jgi:hypothetical protein
VVREIQTGIKRLIFFLLSSKFWHKTYYKVRELAFFDTNLHNYPPTTRHAGEYECLDKLGRKLLARIACD